MSSSINLQLPSITIEVDPKYDINPFYRKKNLKVLEKSEVTISIKNTSGISGFTSAFQSASVDIVNFLTIDAPIPDAASPFLNTIRIVINDSINPQYNMDIGFVDYQKLEFDNTFGSYIKDIQVKTTSIIEKKFTINAYTLERL